MNPFGTDSGYQAYATAKGVTLVGDEAARTAARVRGTIYLNGAYEERFVGTRPGGQENSWPRENASWPDGTVIAGIPDQVEWASYEAAILEQAKPGSLLTPIAPGKVKRRARVEGAVDVEYAKDWVSFDLVASQTVVIPAVEGLLAGLIGLRRALPGVVIV